MGFTPLAGVLMGTRCGDIDPAIVLNVMDNHNLSTKEMDTLMNKKSGVLGISGVSSDFRDPKLLLKATNALGSPSTCSTIRSARKSALSQLPWAA